MERTSETATYEPIVVAIALALYGFNVSPVQRAKRLYDHFEGECAELPDLVDYMIKYGSAPTGMAFPTAEVYVQHALERYGEEARHRVETERQYNKS
jgi:hypothetical protein